MPRHVGLGRAEIEQILAESCPEDHVARDAADAGRCVLHHLSEVGALDESRTADAFAAAGLTP